MLDDEELSNRILNLIYGPIMSTIFFMGIFLNALTITILCRTKIPVKKDSYANNHKLLRTFTNTTLRQDSSTSTILTQEERSLNLPVDKTILHRHAEIWRVTMVRKKPRRPRIYIYLLWMSGCDLVILGCAFMNFSIPTISHSVSFGIYARTVPIWYTLSNASVVASVWLMLILVKDRYQALCSRLFRTISKQSRTYREIHTKLCLLCTFSIIFASPRFFELSVSYNEPNHLYYIELTPLIESTFYQLGYRIFCSLVFYSIIPYILVFIMLTQICIVLKQASRKRAEMLVNRPQHMINSESDLLIIVLSVRFLVSRLLSIVLDVVECLIGSNIYANSPLTMLGNSVNNLLVVFTSATTFFIYVSVSEKFRCQVMNILGTNSEGTSSHFSRSARQ